MEGCPPLIGDMPKKLPQYVYRETTRHGRSAFYFRRGKGKRERLPDFGSPDFEDAYHALLAGIGPTKRTREAAGSLGWLIEQYRGSDAYTGLSTATRRQRDNIFKGVKATAGHMPAKLIDAGRIQQGVDDRGATPAQARHFFDALRGLFRWAAKAQHVKADPTAGMEGPSRPKTDGWEPWTDADVAAYERRWKRGSRERLWLRVLLYTGLRRGDAALLGRQHVKDGWAAMKTEKTKTVVYFPIFDELAEAIQDGPTGDLTFIVGEKGRPFVKEAFGNAFREACMAAGVTKRAHGLRKLAATRAAEKGLTIPEMNAMFGWEGTAMAMKYTKAAERRRLARAGAEKIMNAERPPLEGNAPHLGKR